MRKKKKFNIYVDMDGVIADFNAEADAVNRFETEKGFFKKLKPMNEFGMRQLLANKNVNLFILSASPNEQADQDKKDWLKYYYPQIKKSHIIIMRCGENKADFMKTKKGLLLDDWGKNCEQWRARGNRAIQIKKTMAEHFHEFMTMPILDY